jgi:glycerol-3-phosphate acyltransferase PlsY
MNSFEVTNSKRIGIIVFFLDFIKGLAPVMLTYYFINSTFAVVGLVLCLVVFAHCYSPWLGFKGGKGLASAAGGAIFLSPFILTGWVAAWGIFYYLIKRDINRANIFASLIIWIFSIIFVNLFTPLPGNLYVGQFEFRFFVSLLFFIILSKHFSYFRSIRVKKRGIYD